MQIIPFNKAIPLASPSAHKIIQEIKPQEHKKSEKVPKTVHKIIQRKSSTMSNSSANNNFSFETNSTSDFCVHILEKIIKKSKNEYLIAKIETATTNLDDHHQKLVLEDYSSETLIWIRFAIVFFNFQLFRSDVVRVCQSESLQNLLLLVDFVIKLVKVLENESIDDFCTNSFIFLECVCSVLSEKESIDEESETILDLIGNIDDFSQRNMYKTQIASSISMMEIVENKKVSTFTIENFSF